jgi:RimJ/RimL family protein N-acetyltransferase
MPKIKSIRELNELNYLQVRNEIVNLLLNNEVHRFLDLECNIEETHIQNKVDQWFKNDLHFFIIELENEVKGYIRLTNYNASHHFASISFALEAKLWKKGIMISSIEKILNNELKQHLIHRIEAQVHEHNTRSLKMLKQLGFEIEGIQKENFLIGNQYFNSIMMAKLIV